MDTELAFMLALVGGAFAVLAGLTLVLLYLVATLVLFTGAAFVLFFGWVGERVGSSNT